MTSSDKHIMRMIELAERLLAGSNTGSLDGDLELTFSRLMQVAKRRNEREHQARGGSWSNFIVIDPVCRVLIDECLANPNILRWRLDQIVAQHDEQLATEAQAR